MSFAVFANSGMSFPQGLAFDTSGNLYVANADNNTVSRVTPGGDVSTFASGFSRPVGLAFDTNGNLYVANIILGTVSKVTPAGSVSEFASGFFNPTGLAFNFGNLYVASQDNNSVYIVQSTGTVISFVIGAFSAPSGLAFDTIGNLYVANIGNNTVSKVNPFGDTVSTFASEFNGPIGLAFDNYGNLYVTNNGNNTISEVDSSGTIIDTLNLSNSPLFLAFDSNSYLYVSTSDNNVLKSTVVICFNEGTKILCLNADLKEEYIPIELLKKGDLVKSYLHGYRKIDLIGKGNVINNHMEKTQSMYKMEKTETNGLLEDLIITGYHSILVDQLSEEEKEEQKQMNFEQSIDDKQLLFACVSKDFQQLQDNNVYHYYHFILENDGDDEKRFGVYANGVLCETPSKTLFLKKYSEHNINLL